MSYSVDINCDVGEGLGNESALMPFISSCSIACGGHAGDDLTINETIKLALKNNVNIGAHPSFPDRKNFGRKVMDLDEKYLQQSLEDQINLVDTHAKRLGATLYHVKAHGALYNQAARDPKTAQIILHAVKNTVKNTVLFVPYNSIIEKLALKNKIETKVEAFADRNYNENLTLVSRTNENAIITDRDLLLEHLLKMIIRKKVKTISGVEVDIFADTYCIHGDNPNAVEILKYVSKKFIEKGIKIE
ncbi:MAG: 5-oxoprolinase subunit PxpA [Aureibaculum sp.]